MLLADAIPDTGISFPFLNKTRNQIEVSFPLLKAVPARADDQKASNVPHQDQHRPYGR